MRNFGKGKKEVKSMWPVHVTFIIGLLVITLLLIYLVTSKGISSKIFAFPNLISIIFCSYCVISVIFIRLCDFWYTYRKFKYKESDFPKEIISFGAFYWDSEMSYIGLIFASIPFLYPLIRFCFNSDTYKGYNSVFGLHMGFIVVSLYVLCFMIASVLSDTSERNKLESQEHKLRRDKRELTTHYVMISTKSLNKIINALSRQSQYLSRIDRNMSNYPTSAEVDKNIKDIIKEIDKPLKRE